jgi:hypothetical protein
MTSPPALDVASNGTNCGTGATTPISLQEARRCASPRRRSARGGSAASASGWAYADPTGAPVGRGGMSWTILEGTERAEIGWALRRAAWGRGYATEIGRAGLDYAFSVLGVEQVVSFTEGPQRALACGHGAAGDALRPPDTATGADRRIGRRARSRALRALPNHPLRLRRSATAAVVFTQRRGRVILQSRTSALRSSKKFDRPWSAIMVTESAPLRHERASDRSRSMNVGKESITRTTQNAFSLRYRAFSPAASTGIYLLERDQVPTRRQDGWPTTGCNRSWSTT